MSVGLETPVGKLRPVPAVARRATRFGGDGRGFHPAIVRTHSCALALSVKPGNRRRNSAAADNFPSARA
jgi:hypothetical protein